MDTSVDFESIHPGLESRCSHFFCLFYFFMFYFFLSFLLSLLTFSYFITPYDAQAFSTLIINKKIDLVYFQSNVGHHLGLASHVNITRAFFESNAGMDDGGNGDVVVSIFSFANYITSSLRWRALDGWRNSWNRESYTSGHFI